MPHRRSNLDVAAMHGDDLTGEVQSYADALNVVYFFFPVKAFEDYPLSALRDSFAAVGYVDFHIELPALNGNLNVAPCRGVLHRIVQNVEQGFTCPFPVVGQRYICWTIHADMNILPFCVQQNTAQRRRQGIVKRLYLSVQ